MEKRPSSASTHADPAHLSHVFVFPDVFPSHCQLFLDRNTHVAVLLFREETESPPLLRFVPLTPTSANIFLALLHAYPLHCTHQSLYRSLYPSSGGTDEDLWWDQMKAFALPIIRRALKTLGPALRSCGLRVVSLRGEGYLLAHAPGPQEQTEQTNRSLCSSAPLVRAPGP